MSVNWAREKQLRMWWRMPERSQAIKQSVTVHKKSRKAEPSNAHWKRARVLSPEEKCLLDRCQTQIFLAVTGLWSSGKVSLLASKNFSNVVVTSHSSCVFLCLFSSANISLVRLVLYLQDWCCVGKRETSFPVNKTVTDLLAAIFVAFNNEK